MESPDRFYRKKVAQPHTILAYVLFVTVMMHLAAALYHGLIRRDGVLESMASWRGK
jgi:cytochrome b561